MFAIPAALYSNNPLTLQCKIIQRTLPIKRHWVALEYGFRQFVAIAPGAEYVYSTDGISWTTAVLPISRDWCAYTVGEQNCIIVSTDAVALVGQPGNWDLVDIPMIGNIVCATYSDKFIVVGNKSAAISEDGIEWETVEVGDNCWTKLIYGSGVYIVYGGKQCAVSTGGTVWIPVNLGIGEIITVSHGNGVFIAIGSAGIVRSVDGVNWVASELKQDIGWTALVYGGRTWVAVAAYRFDCATSVDGIVWTYHSAPVAGAFKCGAYGAGRTVFLGDNQTTAVVVM